MLQLAKALLLLSFPKSVKIVSVPKIETFELKPMTARFTVYRPVFTMIPARMLSTPSFVCRNAVTKPEQTPAAIAAKIARKG